MKRRLLITVLAVCLVGAGGFALKLWADGCCTGDPLCNGGSTKVAGTDCDYYFHVDHDRDSYGEGHTVWVYVKQGGLSAVGYMCNLQTPDPQPVCMEFGRTITMSSDNDYTYWFECWVGGSMCGRDPDGSAVYSLNLDSNCNPQ